MSYSLKATRLASESMENVFEWKEERHHRPKGHGKGGDLLVRWRVKLQHGNQRGMDEDVPRMSTFTCDVFALPKGPPLSSNTSPVVREFTSLLSMWDP